MCVEGGGGMLKSFVSLFIPLSASVDSLKEA